jgi:hypothetical protein
VAGRRTPTASTQAPAELIARHRRVPRRACHVPVQASSHRVSHSRDPGGHLAVRRGAGLDEVVVSPRAADDLEPASGPLPLRATGLARGHRHLEQLPAAPSSSCRLLHRPHLRAMGMRVLDWLIEAQTLPDGGLRPVGNDGWWPRGGVAARFDQQAISVTSVLLAAGIALEATGASRYRDAMESAYGWYLGRNDAGESVANPRSGACGDGIWAGGVSLNQGAESTSCGSSSRAHPWSTARTLPAATRSEARGGGLSRPDLSQPAEDGRAGWRDAARGRRNRGDARWSRGSYCRTSRRRGDIAVALVLIGCQRWLVEVTDDPPRWWSGDCPKGTGAGPTVRDDRQPARSRARPGCPAASAPRATGSWMRSSSCQWCIVGEHQSCSHCPRESARRHRGRGRALLRAPPLSVTISNVQVKRLDELRQDRSHRTRCTSVLELRVVG